MRRARPSWQNWDRDVEGDSEGVARWWPWPWKLPPAQPSPTCVSPDHDAPAKQPAFLFSSPAAPSEPFPRYFLGSPSPSPSSPPSPAPSPLTNLRVQHLGFPMEPPNPSTGPFSPSNAGKASLPPFPLSQGPCFYHHAVIPAPACNDTRSANTDITQTGGESSPPHPQTASLGGVFTLAISRIAQKKKIRGKKKFQAKKMHKTWEEGAQGGVARTGSPSLPARRYLLGDGSILAPRASFIPPSNPVPRSRSFNPFAKPAGAVGFVSPLLCKLLCPGQMPFPTFTWLPGNLSAGLGPGFLCFSPSVSCEKINEGRCSLGVSVPGRMEEQHRFQASLTFTAINGNAYTGLRFKLKKIQ